MNWMQLVLATIQSLSIVVNNPALGGGSSLRMQEISELLAIFGGLIEQGEKGYEDLTRFAALVKSMADQGREPTVTEWDALRARDKAADQAIDEAVARAKEAEDGLDSLSDEELVDVINAELSDSERETAEPPETREQAIALIRAVRAAKE